MISRVVRAESDADAVINVGPFRVVITGINSWCGLVHECHRNFEVSELIGASEAGRISGPAWERFQSGGYFLRGERFRH